MGANDYAKKVVSEFITDITDHLFLSIEQDDQKMREYMTNVDRFGKDTVNMAIGKKIATILNLENGEKNYRLKAVLLWNICATKHKSKINDT